MKIEMARPEAVAAVRRNRSPVGELAVLEAEYLQRAGILRLAAGRIVAAGDQNGRIIRGCRANLVREDAAVEDGGLLHFLADSAVRINSMHRGSARIVVSRQGVGAAIVERYVDWTRRQCGGRAVSLQRAIAGIDA